MPEAPTLPEELLELIFSYFHPAEDYLYSILDTSEDCQAIRENRHVLASLCLVSKQCCRLAQRFLYHTIHLVAGPGPFNASYMLQKLVRTLVYQPIFTGYIVKLRVDAVFLDDTPGERDSWDFPYEDAVDSFCALDQDATFRQTLLNNLRDGTLGAHTALLLAMCQDAQSMTITFPHRNDNLARRVLYDAAGGLNPFVNIDSQALTSLKTLTLQSNAEDGALLSDFVHLVRLPRLERFYGWALDCTSETWSQGDGFASNLTCIDLNSCLIDADGMKFILQACPNLQDLAVLWGETLLGDYEKDFDGIGEQLNRYGKRLRNLTFDVDQSHYDVGSGLGNLSSMASLKSLTALGEVLVGRNEPTDIKLPASLEHLVVRPAVMENDENFWEQLRSVADRGNLHNLVTIKCFGYEKNDTTVFWSKTTGYSE